MLKKCDGRTNERTDERTDGQTDLCIELRYAQLKMIPVLGELSSIGWQAA